MFVKKEKLLLVVTYWVFISLDRDEKYKAPGEDWTHKQASLTNQYKTQRAQHDVLLHMSIVFC